MNFEEQKNTKRYINKQNRSFTYNHFDSFVSVKSFIEYFKNVLENSMVKRK